MNGRPLLAALVFSAAALTAQQPGAPPPDHMMGDPMAMQEMMGPALVRTLVYAPQHLLARKEAVGLGADQVSRLAALRDAAQREARAAMAEARTHLAAIEQAQDTAALRVHFEAAHAAMGKAHWAMLVSAVQAKAVLNDAQRTKVQAWADSLHAWMEQHRQMMKPHAPL